MKKALMLVSMLGLMVFLLSAGDFPVKESETIEKTLKFGGGTEARTFEIDNVMGSIAVSGYNGDVVILKAIKTIRAKSAEKLQKAKETVKLDISDTGNSIRLIVNGPFRKEGGCIDWDKFVMGYEVQYDFEVKVPVQTGIALGTIDKGDVTVNDIKGKSTVKNVNGKITISKLNGDFHVRTVNGKIDMAGITGSGEAHTVNGKVTLLFDKNPGSDCSVKTINGNLEVTFLPGLGADFQFKTFNGKIYSDFPSTYLPVRPAKGERKDGKFVYRSSDFQGVRVGNGGPTIKMDTLNGNIIISKI